MMMDTSNKREAGQFEPPPWEREQFEELRRRRQEQERLEQLAASEVVPEEQPPGTELQPAETARDAEVSQEDVASDQRMKEKPSREGTDEKMMAAMLLQLQAEEPARNEALWKIGIVFSVGATAIGLVLLTWGIVAMVRTGSLGATGVVGSTILMAFGGLFVGLGIWTAVRSLKQRGVL